MLFEIADYTATHRCRGSRGGGLSLSVQKAREFKQRSGLEVKLQQCKSESVFLEVQSSVQNEKKREIVGCMYRPPNTDFNKLREGLVGVVEHVCNIRRENIATYWVISILIF